MGNRIKLPENSFSRTLLQGGPFPDSVRRRPVGVFDSGIGGLTVFKALRALMPQENMIYFGDTAHVPYGSKSRASIARFSVNIARFLMEQDIKALVVACNTSSALAFEDIQKSVPVPVLGVIEPSVQRACASPKARRIGVIGTEATIKSQAYVLAIKTLTPKAKVFQVPCPLLAPLVEEGWWHHPVTEEVARIYLKTLQRAKVDALILGCTHYPVIKKILARVMGPRARLIDSGEETARALRNCLLNLGLDKKTGKGWSHFYVSDDPRRFLALSRRFLGDGVKNVSRKSFD